MSTRFTSIASGLVIAAALGSAAAAQQPRIQNAALTTQAAATPFAESFRAMVSAVQDVGWIGYAVPVTDGERVMCCSNAGTYVDGSNVSGCCGLCRLENSSGTTMSPRPQAASPAGVIKLEGADQMM